MSSGDGIGLEFLLLLFVLLSILIGVLASSRGRSGFGWFILSLIFSPILTFLVVLLLDDLKKSNQTAYPDDIPNPDTHVTCPDCRELVKNEARKCRFCGASLIPLSEQKGYIK
jgi:hypothetical protein